MANIFKGIIVLLFTRTILTIILPVSILPVSIRPPSITEKAYINADMQLRLIKQCLNLK